MVELLIKLKLALLRRSMSGQRAVQLLMGALAGLLLAAATVYAAGVDFAVPSVSGDVLAVLFGLWLLFWAFGPLMFGGGDSELRPEHFALYPIPPRKLAAGLLGAGFIGVTPLVSLVAFAALIVYGAKLSFAAAVVAVPAVVLQLALVVLVSRVISSLRGQVVRSRSSAVLSGLFTGVLMAAASSIWAISPAIGSALANGFSPAFATVVRILPSGWGLVAVDGAARSDWVAGLGLLAALLVVDVLLLLLWARLLVKEITTGGGGHTTVSARRKTTPETTGGRRTTPVGGFVVKEVLTWFRDTTRTQFFVFAFVYGALQTVAPLLLDERSFLPWTGVSVVLWMTAVIANLHATDGTALWLTLVTPGGARVDVRGRQFAWLIVVAPVALLLCVVFTALSGITWAWPWALGLTAAALGAGAGAVVLVSVFMLVPMSDPQRRGSGVWENSIDAVQVLAALALVALTCTPTFVLLRLGSDTGSPALSWLGVPAGIASGALAAWLFGRIAHRRLESHGPDLLHLMRSGHRSTVRGVTPLGAGVAGEPDREASPEDLGPVWPAVVAVTCLIVCWVPIFPQGLIPAFLKLSDDDAPHSWFLALYLPEAWQWPVIALMIVVGVAILSVAFYLGRKYPGRLSPPNGGRFGRPPAGGKPSFRRTADRSGQREKVKAD
ncbi:hypothetical protein [Amycolatopsis sp. lyj-346]|uniref:hypothetical protein n=1 Tax=Amycolatopsis sp. lyj-346 TaxID=2789289 RepID=UPI00397BB020